MSRWSGRRENPLADRVEESGRFAGYDRDDLEYLVTSTHEELTARNAGHGTGHANMFPCYDWDAENGQVFVDGLNTTDEAIWDGGRSALSGSEQGHPWE